MSITKVTQDVLSTVPAGLAIDTPTITAPVLSGSVTGTYTLAGTPTITTPTITGGVASADPTAALGISTKQYADNKASNTQQNPIINGNMEIWQRGSSFVTPATAAYTADRWTLVYANAAAVTIIRSSASVPTVAQAGVLFNYSLEVDVTTADAALGAADFSVIRTTIEGYNWRHFAQRIFTVSFWVLSSKTGVHCLFLSGTGTSNMYVAEYTVNSADTWEQKTITVPASPATGSWDYTTGTGLQLNWVMMAGSSFNMTAGTWQVPGGSRFSTSNQVNVMDNVANFFRLTGVKLELGSTATPIQFVPFETELARAMRYYQKSFAYGTTPASNLGIGLNEVTYISGTAGAVASFSPTFPFSPKLRAQPFVTLFNPSAANAQVRNATDGADCTGSSAFTGSEAGLTVTCTGTAGTAVGEKLSICWTADAEF